MIPHEVIAKYLARELTARWWDEGQRRKWVLKEELPDWSDGYVEELEEEVDRAWGELLTMTAAHQEVAIALVEEGWFVRGSSRRGPLRLEQMKKDAGQA